MKKILMFVSFCLLCFALNAQTANNQKFLNRYTKLVKRVQVEYSQNPDSVAAWKAERKAIQTLYKEKYRDSFSDEEIEEYSSLNAQYKSKMTEMKLNDLGEKVDSIGSNVRKNVKRTSKKVSGFIEGLKKQSDANRKK